MVKKETQEEELNKIWEYPFGTVKSVSFFQNGGLEGVSQPVEYFNNFGDRFREIGFPPNHGYIDIGLSRTANIKGIEVSGWGSCLTQIQILTSADRQKWVTVGNSMVSGIRVLFGGRLEIRNLRD